MSTDGVGIAISIYKFIKESPCPSPNTTTQDDTHIIAFDDGRVNLFQGAQKDANGEFVSTRLTAKYYQTKAKIHEHTEWEKQRRINNPNLAAIYDDMSKHTWRTPNLGDFLGMVECFLSHKNALTEEHIVSKEHALWRMLLWRKKMSVMMRAVARTVRRCDLKPNTKVILSVGNAKFASTGRKGAERERHGGVPTKRIGKLMVRTMRCLKLRFVYMEVDEYLTTRCCHKCGTRMNDVYDAAGVEVRGLKCCPECSRRESTIKTRNRDANAAKNMWMITDNLIRGLERPSYLKRVKASRQQRQPR